MDFQIGRKVLRKIKTIAGGAALSGQHHEVQVGVVKQEIKFRCEIGSARLAELRIDIFVNGNERGRQRQRFQRSVETTNVVHGRNGASLQRFFGVFGILRPIDKAHRIPRITLAPLHHLLSRLENQILIGLCRGVGFEQLGVFVPALKVIAHQRVGFEKHREPIFFVASFQAQAKVVLIEQAILRVVKKPRVVNRRAAIDSK